MGFYVTLILSMTLACVAGVLYFYMMFLEARNRQGARRVAELERENAALREALRRAEAAAGQGGGAEDDGEVWPDVIGDEEGDGYSLQ